LCVFLIQTGSKGHREIVQPDFAFVAGLENANVHPLGQIVAVKADPPVAVLENTVGMTNSRLLFLRRQIKQKLHPVFASTR
jgi:hypothetical protein